MPTEQQHDQTRTEREGAPERKAEQQDIDRREDEAYSDPESSAQKLPPEGPRP
jgi:hypothetical protein